jgi:SOS response regulatory protein OraA/RecX
MPSAYLDALHMLSRRGLTVHECRSRLAERQHPESEIDAAIEHLLETGGLNDHKLARAQAETAVEIKGRGRLRILRELAARGVDRETASRAVAEAFENRDERRLIARALERKLRGRPKPTTAAELARLYQYLMRQGFTPAAVSAALRSLRRGSAAEPDSDDVQ